MLVYDRFGDLHFYESALSVCLTFVCLPVNCTRFRVRQIQEENLASNTTLHIDCDTWAIDVPGKLGKECAGQ